VPGIGMSTAAKLLRKFDCLEQLFLQSDEISTMQIKGAVRIQHLIKEHQATIELSRKLTEINCDVENVKDEDFNIKPYDCSEFIQFCHQLKLSEQSIDAWIKLHSILSKTE